MGGAGGGGVGVMVGCGGGGWGGGVEKILVCCLKTAVGDGSGWADCMGDGWVESVVVWIGDESWSFVSDSGRRK